MLVALIVFLLDGDGGLATTACAIFIITVPGYALLGMIGPLKNLDPVERTIVGLVIGIGASVLIVTICVIIIGSTWSAATVFVLMPIVALLLVLSLLIGRKHPHVETPTVLSGLMSEIGSMDKNGRWVMVGSLLAVAAIIIFSVSALLSYDGGTERFTEFYVLNEEGHAYDYPTTLHVGENVTFRIGIVNHEGRTINYTAEIWLVNYHLEEVWENGTYVGSAINVTEMYFLHSFSLTLDSVGYDPDDAWSSQYEGDVQISSPIEGEFRLFFILFEDGENMDLEPEPFANGLNYHHSVAATNRILLCVNNEINYLMLYIDVTA